MRASYVEPSDYFSEETRKKFKIGEYAEDEEAKKREVKKANKKLRDFVNGKE